MIDIYYKSSFTKNAPEANIPIYNIHNIEYKLGGAANVAHNMKLLGCDVHLYSIVGNDDLGKQLIDLIETNGVYGTILVDETKQTTQKHRIIEENQIVCRYDIENTAYCSQDISKYVIEQIDSRIKNVSVDAIIFSDYDKGFLTIDLCKQVIAMANQSNIPTFVDPKMKDTIKYKNCFCFKPNYMEMCKISKMENDIENGINYISQLLDCKHVVVTRGKYGLFVNHYHFTHGEPPPNVVDVTGAGDIVLCILTFVYICKRDIYLAGEVANIISGQSVGCMGNYLLHSKDVLEVIQTRTAANNISLQLPDPPIGGGGANNIHPYKPPRVPFSNYKIIYENEHEKIRIIEKKKQNGEKLVFTNGCFDILHSAHIQLLQYAKSQGDILIVGLNSDVSIRKLKGEMRPINDIRERSKMLSLFQFVNHIIIFDEDTPYNILQTLQPNILVKGGDYTIENIIGKEFCDEIRIFNYIDGKSTTNIIRSIMNGGE